MTISEKITNFFACLIACVLGVIGFFATLMVLGMMLDGVSQYNVEHDRCLKHATNGLEIRACQ